MAILHQTSPGLKKTGITCSIVDIDRNAAGNYTCTAWNGVGGQKKAIAAITVHCEFPCSYLLYQ